MTSCGFDSLPNQVTTRITMNGLAFNIMVVGQPGIGKTTLINSLLDFDYGDTPDHKRETTDVFLKVKEVWPQNKTIKMKLTVIETKGFGNQEDRSRSYKPIVDYIDSRYKDYLKSELKIQESRYNHISDSRVHCCIYMISPTDGLLPIDVVTMKNLHRKVCLIPVIAKSDILTRDEMLYLKDKIRQKIQLHGIQIYLPEDNSQPLAISASNEIVKDGSKRQRVRIYPWGRYLIEKNSEFPLVRDLILKSMISLIDCTNKVHYERHRKTSNSTDDIKKEKLFV